jgi:iron complex transport system ATP-binding protein
MSVSENCELRCIDLTVTVPGRTLISNLRLDIRSGELLAILGPNGVGKSLALHTLSGIRTAQSGTVSLDGNNIHEIERQKIATRLALLPQYTEDIFPATVFDTVMIGRHPHVGRFRWESDTDREIAIDALRQVDLEKLVTRDVNTLSGGERRRLAVAQVLTQAPQIYLLDEPTNHLDPQHQLDVLHIFSEKARLGNAVVASLHDVNLAARFAHRSLLLYGDGRWEIGNTPDVLTGERLTELYTTEMDTVAWRNIKLFVAAGAPAQTAI